MTDLAAKFTTLEGQLATQSTNTIDGITAIITALDIMNENNAANTRYLLAALAKLDPCVDCGATPSLEVPVPGTVPAVVDTVHCARMQVLLALIRKMLVKIDVISTFGLGFSTSIVSAAIGEVVSEAIYPIGMPLPSFVEISTLIGSGLAYVASNILRGDSLVALFDTEYASLLAALYAATSSSAGLEAYHTVIAASGLPADEQGELDAVAFVSWFNWCYDVANTVDTTGFDGSICGGADCLTGDSYIRGDGYSIANWATPYSDNSHTAGNWDGWTLTLTATSTGEDLSVTYYNPGGGYGGVIGYLRNVGDHFDIVGETAAVGAYSRSAPSSVVFSVEICPTAG